jgi:hypothetical protein
MIPLRPLTSPLVRAFRFAFEPAVPGAALFAPLAKGAQRTVHRRRNRLEHRCAAWLRTKTFSCDEKCETAKSKSAPFKKRRVRHPRILEAFACAIREGAAHARISNQASDGENLCYASIGDQLWIPRPYNGLGMTPNKFEGRNCEVKIRTLKDEGCGTRPNLKSSQRRRKSLLRKHWGSTLDSSPIQRARNDPK